ncbi:MAG: DUF3578 domain-containing protein [Flavobacterium sp.]|nr:MAG: DUF3578 domain-containing protein [Flavobacterium sp.]
MAIPQNITRDHLLKAIHKIDTEGIPTDAESQYFDVVFNDKRYPPKLMISYANLFANGEILERSAFTGGKGQPSFRILEQNGFKIENKGDSSEPSYFNELIRFLDQANTGGLKTAHFHNNFLGLNVKVSFGQGTQARVPWISFLASGQSTSNGIYPVYLLYRDINKLFLAYGVSETNKPKSEWNIEKDTLSEYFSKNALGDPKPYPNSFVYEVYDLSQDLNKDEIDTDLRGLIKAYKQKLKQIPTKETENQVDFDFKIFQEDIQNSNLKLDPFITERFMFSLLAKPFVILTGLAGSGKTKLAQTFAKWISKSNEQYCLVPVGADWTNKEPLLGFPNSLTSNEYIKPDNGVLDLIINASLDKQKPYFLILDEMNLSHVERYFADFLSLMESNELLTLYKGEKRRGVPSDIPWPQNLFIIGTVNVDETTYMFSPKVLDRANVIEFRVSEEEMRQFLLEPEIINVENISGAGSAMGESFLRIALSQSYTVSDLHMFSQTLLVFFRELKISGAEFGFRTASEILRLASIASSLNSNWTANVILDVAIIQKLLPKLHGSRSKIAGPLTSLAKLCVANGESDYSGKDEEFRKIFFQESIEPVFAKKVVYALSFKKIARMYKNAIDNGYTSYAEA